MTDVVRIVYIFRRTTSETALRLRVLEFTQELM